MEMDLSVIEAAAAALGPVGAPLISPYPVATQDVALLVPESVPAAEVEAALADGVQHSEYQGLLEEVRLFDVYTGEQAGPGRKSLAYTLRFRAPDRTLTVEETTAARDAAVEEAARRVGCGAPRGIVSGAVRSRSRCQYLWRDLFSGRNYDARSYVGTVPTRGWQANTDRSQNGGGGLRAVIDTVARRPGAGLKEEQIASGESGIPHDGQSPRGTVTAVGTRPPSARSSGSPSSGRCGPPRCCPSPGTSWPGWPSPCWSSPARTRRCSPRSLSRSASSRLSPAA